MRPLFSGLAGVAIAVLLLAVSTSTQSARRVAPAASTSAGLTGAALKAPPKAGWPTNGGNLYNQRYSPLTAINRGNVAQL